MTTTPRFGNPRRKSTPRTRSERGDGPALDGQIAALKDGGYVVIWETNSGVYNPPARPLWRRDITPRATRSAGRSSK